MSSRDQRERMPRRAPAPDNGPLPGADDALAVERAARLAAERINAMRDEFLGMVSHELRTPLNAMVGWLHVLESSQNSDASMAQRAVAGLGRAVRQQCELVDTLLQAARALRGDLALAPERVDLGALVAAAVQARQEVTPALAIELQPPQVPCRAMADPQCLRQALDELFAHAARFAGRGRLCVQTARVPDDPSHVQVSLRFDAQDADVAWEPFREPEADTTQQATLSRRRRGATLGLALCQRLVELSGGTMRVADGPPARLLVVLPDADAPAARPRSGPPADAG